MDSKEGWRGRVALGGVEIQRASKNFYNRKMDVAEQWKQEC
jgi:hypothetical protein